LIACVSGLALSQPAAAQDTDGGHVSAGLTAGTLGIGPEIGYRFNETVGIRANAGLLSVNASVDDDDIEYDGDFDLRSFGVMIDVFPFGGGFRISGGARLNRNKVELSATPTTSVEVGNATYTAAQVGTLSGRASVKDFAPQLTLGYAGSLRKGIVFTAEAGVLFQGSVRLRDFQSSGTLASNAAFRADLERERLNLQDEIDDYKLYPIAQIGLLYRF
jgi:hypothetical protein